MNSQPESVSLELPSTEALILITHLTEFLNGSQGRIKRLINKKFYLIEAVLFAKFGFKNSLVYGFQKQQPYFTENHWQLVREITEIENKVRRMEYSNHYLEIIRKKIVNQTNGIVQAHYESYLIYDASKWKQVENNYIGLGIQKNEAELKNLITELCNKFS